MNKFIEDEKILTFGNKSIDVSNVAYGRIEIASELWNKERTDEKMTAKSFNDMVVKIGIFMIVQDFAVLRLRMNFFKACISWFRRLFITEKTIKQSNAKEYEAFEDWIYEQITGDKKKDLLIDAEMMKMSRDVYKKMMEQGKTLEQCTELLSTLLQSLVSDIKNL